MKESVSKNCSTKHVKIHVSLSVTLQAKGKERQWLRHQATGELDDAKIIDGLAGEKSIYKRRGDLEPQVNNGEPRASDPHSSAFCTEFMSCVKTPLTQNMQLQKALWET
jgi:hypothetical protein